MTTNAQQIFQNLLAKHKLTFKSMQNLVMSMADYANGKDKEETLLRNLAQTLVAMNKEGVITLDLPLEAITENFFREFTIFQSAFPNWQDAYGYLNSSAFTKNLNATIQYLKSNGTKQPLVNQGPSWTLIFIAYVICAFIFFKFTTFNYNFASGLGAAIVPLIIGIIATCIPITPKKNILFLIVFCSISSFLIYTNFHTDQQQKKHFILYKETAID